MWGSLVTIAIALATPALAADKCAVDDSDKFDCGYVGINATYCQAKGCCWSESDTSGVPWCFYSTGDVTTCFALADASALPFSAEEVSTMRSYFLSNVNIEGKGGVVASPDNSTPGGSYYYHWERDGALTMRALQETADGSYDVASYMESYISWVLNVQSEDDPNDIDVRTEPKYYLPDGKVFDEAWCRPQNDGPGLRAISMMIYADLADEDYVKQYLWTGDESQYNGGAIKHDLDYLLDGWDTNTCDLWEEVQSTDFFWNRVTMKKALVMGADFADSMGDSSSAAAYRSTASSVNATLFSGHWTGSFVFESTGRQKDGAVIVGFNDGYLEEDGMFAPTSYEVAATVQAYNLAFCNEWAINTKDTDSGLPGVLYGRYPGDTYAGGNPWVLTTAALANLFYRAAAQVKTDGLPGATAQATWADALGLDAFPATTTAAANLFLRAGDSVLLRLRSHVEADGFHLAEQIDRNTGEQLSAADLTWSYAEVLNAMHSRDVYTAL